MTKKKIAFISVARSDFGRLFPTLQAVENAPGLELNLIVSGNHSSEKFGSTLREIKESGLGIDFTIELKSVQMAGKEIEIQDSLARWLESARPDYFVILGDRYEMLAAAKACQEFSIPIIHIGGGYQTAGAIDERIRHEISKLSTYHFVATEKCAARVGKLLGHSENIIISGAPDLEILKNIKPLSKKEFYDSCLLDISRPFILVTVHPETLATLEENELFLEELEDFLMELEEQILITAPCADPGSELVFGMIDSLQESRSGVSFIESLGMQKYATAMKYAKMIIGNSSSGIIESATMSIPVLNAGNRQGGRETNENVIHSPFEKAALLQAYKKLKTAKFKKMCREIDNIYGDGHFSESFINFLNILQ